MSDNLVRMAELIHGAVALDRDAVVEVRTPQGATRALAIVVSDPRTAEYLLGILELGASRRYEHVALAIPGRG